MGGVIVGEHLSTNVFRAIDISFQESGGTFAHFVRDPEHHRAFLDAFFSKTGDYRRFNYLGEWHSHPSFEPLPSSEDTQTMSRLVHDPDVGANFLVLVIARLNSENVLELSATLFRRGAGPEPVSVEVQPAEPRGWLARSISRLLG